MSKRAKSLNSLGFFMKIDLTFGDISGIITLDAERETLICLRNNNGD